MNWNNECDAGTGQIVDVSEEHGKMTVNAASACRWDGSGVCKQLTLQ